MRAISEPDSGKLPRGFVQALRSGQALPVRNRRNRSFEGNAMASIPHHPNDPGTWARLEGREGFALWRRKHQALAPVTMYYVIAPPRQSEILYDEAKARARFNELTGVRGADDVVP